MDHLLLHPFGLTIVESKSVAGSVQIKDDGQWIRWFDKRPQGMRSPVIQAKMQGMLLRDLLNRTVKQKGFFDSVELDVLTAISDAGTIQWPSTGWIPEVCKADQVPEKVLGKVSSSRQSGAVEILTPQHRHAIAEFLKKIHQPVGASPVSRKVPDAPSSQNAIGPEASPAVNVRAPAASLPERACRHCGSTQVQAQYGKFGYYFACSACEKNSSIKFACPSCGAEGRVRKQGNQFFAECKSCEASVLYHTNS
ncbi:MAG: NERD domain-containing protein [Ramlibacter sp.]